MVRGGCARAMLARRCARTGLAFLSLFSFRGTTLPSRGGNRWFCRRFVSRSVSWVRGEVSGPVCEGRKEVSFAGAAAAHPGRAPWRLARSGAAVVSNATAPPGDLVVGSR